MHNSKHDMGLIFDELYRVLKPGGHLYSELSKDGDFENPFQLTRLKENELKAALGKFDHIEINYTSLTKDHGTKELINYLVEAKK